jgi:hypothetical protein
MFGRYISRWRDGESEREVYLFFSSTSNKLPELLEKKKKKDAYTLSYNHITQTFHCLERIS